MERRDASGAAIMSTSSSSSSLTSASGKRQPQHSINGSNNTPFERDYTCIVRQTPPSWGQQQQQRPSQQQQLTNPYVTPRPVAAPSAQRRQQPLVLDPSSTSTSYGGPSPYHMASPEVASASSSLRSVHSSTGNSNNCSMTRSGGEHRGPSSAMRRILQAATTSTTKRRSDDHHHGRTNTTTTTSLLTSRSYKYTTPPQREEHIQHRQASAASREQQNQQQHTAASFARTAPRAGFLSKLGSNIPEFKRRFFVLKPSTHLYYFVSPADTEPRGCIDLDSASVDVELLEDLPDGRCRFAIVWLSQQQQQHQYSSNDHDGGGGTNTTQRRQRIVLEARSRDVAEEWMHSIREERLDVVKQGMAELRGVNAQYKSRVEELEEEIRQYKLVERDRDGALEDAANWKNQFERLNEGLRLLTQHLRRPPSTESVKDGESDGSVVVETTTGNPEDTEAVDENENSATDTSHEDDDDSNDTVDIDATDSASAEATTNDVTPQSTNKRSTFVSPLNASHRETSLLDEIGDDEQQIDDLEFPGTHFSSLRNACQQLHENLRLASMEASSAGEDLTAVNETMASTEKRMAKAEKHICKLWEENCAMRKSLKQTKAEKRVLVKEVKSLMGVVNDTSQKLRDMSIQQDRQHMHSLTERDDEDDTRNLSPTEEERLIDELEEHVMTSIRLHEQFLGVNSGLADHLQDSVKKIETGTYAENDDESSELASRPSSRFSQATESSAAPTQIDQPRVSEVTTAPAEAVNTSATTYSTDTGGSAPMSPIKPMLLSLLDDEDDDDDSDYEDDIDNAEEASGPPSVISSVGAEFGDSYENMSDDAKVETGSIAAMPVERTSVHPGNELEIPLSVESYSAFTSLAEEERSISVASTEDERKHPILQLEEELADEGSAPNLCASSTQSESSKSVVTDNGNATSRLFCPLADVVGTRRNKAKQEVDSSVLQDGKVYHLTFYSRRIGLQFQKVPATPSSRGLLTEAMTADLSTAGGDNGDSSSADLRRIAAISNMANAAGSSQKSDDVCQVATPVDAVLVCGFHGFVDQSKHTRPKLGARLVAFDGVSLEVGRWTFDSVRKAIQARGRPLTLSFRNDFLTTKQRAILTKAVADVEKSIPPPRRTIQYKQTIRPPSAEPESIVSSTSHETDQFVNDAHPPLDDDDLSVSVASSSNLPYSTFGRSFSTSQASVGSYQNFRSFSDAGSSSVFSSTSTLVGNLMNGLSKKKSGGVPQYLQSKPESSLENAPHHQDFTSSLL